MKQKILDYYVSLNKTYNELVLWHVTAIPMLAISILVAYWVMDLNSFLLFLFLLSLLVFPSRYIVNKRRTCPSCKTWIYSGRSQK